MLPETIIFTIMTLNKLCELTDVPYGISKIQFLLG